MIVLGLDSSPELSNVMNFQVVQREPNQVLFKYKKIMSFIFFVSSLVCLFNYCLKVYPLHFKEIGFIKKLIFANLLTMVIYNFLYSCSS